MRKSNFIVDRSWALRKVGVGTDVEDVVESTGALGLKALIIAKRYSRLVGRPSRLRLFHLLGMMTTSQSARAPATMAI